MKKQSKLILTLTILIFLSAILIFLYPKIDRKIQIAIDEERNGKAILEAKKNSSSIDQYNSKSQKSLPESFYLNVPFVCQAPLETETNWKLHEESCEEAAVLQAYQYETGKIMDKKTANEEILAMIAWQMKNFGAHKDLQDNDLKEFITGYYKIKDSEIKMIPNSTIEDIKREVNNGHPVIVPITGDLLDNPFYPYPGYHMLVVIGYTKDSMITNDNGTKRGSNYSYDVDVFEKAFQDAGASIFIFELEPKD